LGAELGLSLPHSTFPHPAVSQPSLGRKSFGGVELGLRLPSSALRPPSDGNKCLGCRVGARHTPVLRPPSNGNIFIFYLGFRVGETPTPPPPRPRSSPFPAVLSPLWQRLDPPVTEVESMMRIAYAHSDYSFYIPLASKIFPISSHIVLASRFV